MQAKPRIVQTDKHVIEEGLYIFKQSNSSRWYARMKIDGKWFPRATKEKELGRAVTEAIRLQTLFQFRADHELPISTREFKDVAELAIEKMHSLPERTKGYSSFKNYENILRRYHIPFFNRTHISSIDQDLMVKFDQWRAEKAGKTLARSTLNNHNCALQRVFALAVDNKWAKASKLPDITINEGRSSERRGYFTAKEMETILDTFPAWITKGYKALSRDIRQLLHYYVRVALYTGLRPGTEMENLTWGDIDMDYAKREATITVRKGKTTLITGPRTIVCHEKVFNLLAEVGDLYDQRADVFKPTDPIFRIPGGQDSDHMSKNFTRLLHELGLKDSVDGPRTLYSLRHTYITLQLLSKKSSFEAIASHCGTGVDMIQQHYNHIKPRMYAAELMHNGSEINQLIDKLVLDTPTAFA